MRNTKTLRNYAAQSLGFQFDNGHLAKKLKFSVQKKKDSLNSFGLVLLFLVLGLSCVRLSSPGHFGARERRWAVGG